VLAVSTGAPLEQQVISHQQPVASNQ